MVKFFSVYGLGYRLMAELTASVVFAGKGITANTILRNPIPANKPFPCYRETFRETLYGGPSQKAGWKLDGTGMARGQTPDDQECLFTSFAKFLHNFC